MFIGKSNRGYTAGGEQWARGDFLILFDGPTPRTMVACVRYARMRQCGHFMMGHAAIGGAHVTVSGTYGGDGLPCGADALPKAVRDTLVPVPDDLWQAWATGGGHNSAGAEGQSMHDWALGRLDALKAAGAVRLPKAHDIVNIAPQDIRPEAELLVIFAGEEPYGAWKTYQEGGRRYWRELDDFVVMQAKRVRAGKVPIESGKHYRIPFKGKTVRAECVNVGTSLIKTTMFFVREGDKYTQVDVAYNDIP